MIQVSNFYDLKKMITTSLSYSVFLLSQDLSAIIYDLIVRIAFNRVINVLRTFKKDMSVCFFSYNQRV